MAKKFRTDQIPSGNFSEDWGGSASNTVPSASDENNLLPYSGAAVQKFIKDSLQKSEKKVGFYKWSNTVDSSNYYHLYGFADEASYNEWNAGDKEDDAIKALLLVDEALPISTVQGDSYAAYLYSKIGSNVNIVVADGKLEVPLRFCAVRTSNGDRLNVGSKGTIVIQRKTSTSSWATVATLTEAISSTDYSDTNTFTTIDIGKYLGTGSQNIRIQARFEYEDGEGKTQSQSSTYVVIGASVVSTTLSLTCSQDWQTPILASVQQQNGFPYSYTVYGAADKTLHIQITGGNGTVLSIEKALDSTKNGTTIRESYTDATDGYKLFKHGVRLVKAWLTCDDGLGNTIISDVLENRFMVVNPEDGVDKTKPYLMLQNVVSKAVNYTQMDICDYAVYSPKVASDGSITNDGDNLNVVFYLTSYSETFPSDNVTEYFRIEQSVEPGVKNTLNTTIEIEAESNVTDITAYFRAYRRDGDVETDMLEDSLGIDLLSIAVDNSDSYAPTSGATFVLNPKIRNNSESNPQRIINSKGNAVIQSTWTGFGFVNDGWITAEDGVKVLRVPSGAKLNFKYNPFAQFLTTPNSSMTLELDVAMRNITNEKDPIIQICELVAGQYIGLRMKPIEGYIYSASNQVDSETDFQWQEDTRTHIAINIHNAVIPNKGDALVPTEGTSLDTSATTIPLVRVLINGNIEREVRFSVTNKEEFCTGAMSNGGITLGQNGADLDIYSIRCYTNMKLEANDIKNDYISTLPTVAEKQEERRFNDIMTGEKVDVEKVKALGKRVLILHGVEPYMYNQGAQKVWWEIFQYNEDGSYNPELSGTICKETRTKSKRQGSTANTYYYSNIQTKVSDAGNIIVALADIHSSIVWVLNDPIQGDDGTETRTVSIYGGNLGAKDPVENEAKEYKYVDNNGVPSVEVPDGWIDGNGKYRGRGYMIAEDTPLADKLVLKINYASSMQSHLCGCNRLYNDLHTAIVGKNSLQEACEANGYKVRMSKYTEPVYFFTQADDSTEVVYRGGGNFGGGKMDKPTWGYNKKVKGHAMFAMFEGSDNNYELTDMRVPFTLDPSCEEAITYSPSDEGYFYNGLQNLDFDAGATDADSDGNETPKAVLTNRLAEIWNFLYLHAPMIEYYNGTFNAFQLSDAAKNTTKKYWCTEGSDAFKLKRYNFVSGKWVDAGLWNGSSYDIVDLRTDDMTANAYNNSDNKTQYAKLNAELKAAIVQHCKTYIGWYINVKSLRFHYAFINHFMAGTDNCSKNTYYMFDPKAVNVTINGQTKSCILLWLCQDDVDTILPIDNNGRKTKPYYIDRMHPYADTDASKSTSLYEGMNNVLFNLCEEMYEGTRELQSTLNAILSEMTRLVSENDKLDGFTGSTKVSVFGCIWKYMFNIQKYYSATAFNEQARIRYEYPAMIGFISQGSGARGVAPITQSCGSLLQAEIQFMRRRLIYMASYAAWGNFYNGKDYSVGIADATDSFAMQAYHLPDSATSATEYKFTLKPHQYIYPTGMLGQTSVDPHVRVAPDEEYTLVLGTTTSNDTGLSVLGINYYHSIGNIGDLSTSPNMSMTINGKRLTEVIAEPTKQYVDMETGKKVPAFRPQSLTITATKIRKMSLKGCVGIKGTLDLSQMVRLETLNISNTGIVNVVLPESKVLSNIALPGTLTRLALENLPNLKTVTMDGASQLQSLIIGAGIKTGWDIFYMCYTGNAPLKTLRLYNINQSDVTLGLVNYLASVQDSTVTGKLALQNNISNRPTFTDKVNWLAQWGAVDSKSNPLYISYYQTQIAGITIAGSQYVYNVGNHIFDCTPNTAYGNDVVNIRWTIDANLYSTIRGASKNNCTVNISKLGDEDTTAPKTILHCYLTKINGEIVEATWEIGLYPRRAHLGDYVFADGTYGPTKSGKTIVGICFYINPKDAKDRRMVALSNIGGFLWGLYPYNSGQSDEWNQQYAIYPIELQDDGQYSIYDISSIANIGSAGLVATGSQYHSSNYIEAENYLNEETADGFVECGKNTAAGDGIASTDNSGKDSLTAELALLSGAYKTGDEVPVGLVKSLKIIQHRNKILEDSGVSLPIPAATDKETEQAILAQFMSDVVANNGGLSKYQQFYYPAVSKCYAYQPTVKVGEKLADKFKAHNWYLPSVGELCRLYWHSKKGGAYENDNKIGNIFQTAIDESVFSDFTASWYWSSSEGSQFYSWGVYFSNGIFVSYFSKYGSSVVRAVAAF